jgi:hypothetical protein
VFGHHLNEQMDTQRVVVSRRKKKKKNFWTKTGLRVRDDEGDRSSRASMACISPIAAASVVAQRSGGGGGQC